MTTFQSRFNLVGLLLCFFLSTGLRSQTVNCKKLNVWAVAYKIDDSTSNFTIQYLDSVNSTINNICIVSVSDSTNAIILSKSKSQIMAFQNSETLLTYSVPVNSKWQSHKQLNINMRYEDISGKTGIHSCSVPYMPYEVIQCKAVKLVKDSVRIDFSKNMTDLKFTYVTNQLPYPNYRFTSASTILTVEEGFASSYTLFGDNCFQQCPYWTPMQRGLKFRLNTSSPEVVEGTFTISGLRTTGCTYPIHYVLNPGAVSGILDFNVLNNTTDLYPNPVEDILNFKTEQNSPYSITDLSGTEVAKGYIADGTIKVESLPPGIYFIHINLKHYKFVKK